VILDVSNYSELEISKALSCAIQELGPYQLNCRLAELGGKYEVRLSLGTPNEFSAAASQRVENCSARLLSCGDLTEAPRDFSATDQHRVEKPSGWYFPEGTPHEFSAAASQRVENCSARLDAKGTQP